jgi:hypothetical protein
VLLDALLPGTFFGWPKRAVGYFFSQYKEQYKELDNLTNQEYKQIKRVLTDRAGLRGKKLTEAVSVGSPCSSGRKCDN